MAKISVLSSGNVSKYEFLTGKYVCEKKDLLEKVATIKRFESSPLGKELKALDNNAYEFDKIIKKEKPMHKNYSRSDLIIV